MVDTVSDQDMEALGALDTDNKLDNQDMEKSDNLELDNLEMDDLDYFVVY